MGRKKKLTPEEIAKGVELYYKGATFSELGEKFHCSPNTWNLVFAEKNMPVRGLWGRMRPSRHKTLKTGLFLKKKS